MKSKKIIIGSRASKLALIYAEKAKEMILKISKEFNIESVEIKKITTTGDLNQKVRLSEIGGKGLFSTKIEKELIETEVIESGSANLEQPVEVQAEKDEEKKPKDNLFEEYVDGVFDDVYEGQIVKAKIRLIKKSGVLVDFSYSLFNLACFSDTS